MKPAKGAGTREAPLGTVPFHTGQGKHTTEGPAALTGPTRGKQRQFSNGEAQELRGTNLLLFGVASEPNDIEISPTSWQNP